MSTGSTPHIVVVGGGFAGMSVLKALRTTRARITLVDRHAYSTFQPLLYQVATATLNPGDITYFLRSVRTRRPQVRFVNGTVTAMDHDARTVTLASGRELSYDYLVIATGVTANYFGIEGAAEHAMPLYTRNQAIALRDAIFTRLEQVASAGQSGDLRVVVVGGGATGVETAGALAELRNTDMPVTYPELDASRTHITLVEMMPAVLGPFRDDIQAYAKHALERRGVDLRLCTAVKQVRPDGVVVGDKEEELIPAGVIIWASGVRPHDVVAQWGLPQGRGHRISVDDHLQVQGLDRVWAVGDVAVEDGDRALPQLAQPAMQTGRYVGSLLAAKIDGGADVGRFSYRDLGTMATIGRTAAVAQIPHLPSVTGLPAWLVWMAVHLSQLLGNRNRIASMINLGAKYLFWGGNHNAIVGETRHRVRIPEE